MSAIDGNAYRKEMHDRALSLLVKKDEYDPDVWNLEYMKCLIMPGSSLWETGCRRSLNLAIKALQEVKSRE